MDKACFFIGSRESDASILPALEEAIEMHICVHGVREFIVGGYGGFDSLAARAVIAAKQRHTGIILTRLLAYHPAERTPLLPPGFDGSLYPPGMERVPRNLAIVRANRYAMDHCGYLIAYMRHSIGNTARMLEHACSLQRRGKIILTLLKA